MDICLDIGFESVKKHGEELCGDSMEIIRSENSSIIVLADGLGSGVKANILSTLTTKIIGTMLSRGANIDEAVETIASTLPVCSERGIAYSTFSILQIYNTGSAYLVEFDNPSMLCFRKGKLVELPQSERVIKGKVIKESRFTVAPKDAFVLISDGIVHAGIGRTLNLGWQWGNMAEYLQNISIQDMSAKSIAKQLMSVCQSLYENMPGDDATVGVVKIKVPSVINVMIGPSTQKDIDGEAVRKFSQLAGKKVVCGGTTAQIVARELKKELEIDFNYITPEIPPIAKIKGLDLVTEGVVTLTKTLEYVKHYITDSNRAQDFITFNGRDGASKFTKLLVEEGTHIHFFIGSSISTASDVTSLSFTKMEIVTDLLRCLKSMNKEVTVQYH